MKFNKYWIFIAGFTLLNIFIFSIFSKKLETFVTDKMIDESQTNLNNILVNSSVSNNDLTHNIEE